MPDPITGVIAGGATLLSGASANKQADAQMDQLDRQAQLEKEMFDKRIELAQPFTDFGVSLLPQLGDAMAPLNREKELYDFYQGDEYKILSDQARNEQLAAAEATGGLGSTATGNTLASIAPQLGTNYLSQRYGEQADLFNRLLSGVNIGLSGVGSQVASAGDYTSQAGETMQNMGSVNAGKAAIPFNTLSNLGGMYAGAKLGGYF